MKNQIIYQNLLPNSIDFFSLFETTGWNKKYKITEKDCIRSLQSSWYSVSAYSENKLVGFGRIISDGILYAMINNLIVLPEFQGKGIGTEILNILINKCNTESIRDILLFCAKGKVPFYNRFGFVSRDEDAPGMQLISHPNN